MIGKAATSGALLLLCAVPASAQIQMRPWRDVVFVNVSGAGQTGTRTESYSFSFEKYLETATVDVTRDVKGSSFVDVTVGAALLNNIGAALSIYSRSATSDGVVTGSIPDLGEFNAPRPVNSTVPGMTHRETWVGIQGVYGMGLTEKLDAMFLAGPAIAKVEHDVPLVTADDVLESSSGPVIAVRTTRLSKSFVGFMVGADVRYFFHPNVGAGGFLRWAGASGDFDDGTPIEVGGFQFGAGVRFRY